MIYAGILSKLPQVTLSSFYIGAIVVDHVSLPHIGKTRAFQRLKTAK
jgi:hypothetical protein